MLNFLNYINNKFSKAPADKTKGHRDSKIFGNLDEIICCDYSRKLRNDWTIRLNNEFYQIDKIHEKLCKPEDAIIVKRYLNGKISLFFNETKLNYRKLDFKPEPPFRNKNYYQKKVPMCSIKKSAIAKANKKNSPWNQFNPSWLKQS